MIPGRFRRAVVVAFVVVCAAAAASCGSTMSDAATVTYKDSTGTHTIHITKSELLTQVKQLQDTKQFRPLLVSHNPPFAAASGNDTALTEFSSFWLANLVDQTVVDAEFKSQGLQVTSDQTAAATSQLEQSYSKEAFDAFPKSLRNSLVTGEAHLVAVLSSCASGRLVSHILLPTEAEAKSVFNQIAQGGDFATLAKQYSIDSQSKQSGGVLGCLYPNEFVAPFQSAAESVPFDTVTVPVKSQFGYHLILVRRWNAQEVAADQNVAQSAQQAAGMLLDQRLNGLHVWVNPAFGTWTKVPTQSGGTTYSVLKPQVPQPRDAREPTTVPPSVPSSP